MICWVCESLQVSGLTSVDLTDLPSELSGLVFLSHLSDLNSLSASIAKILQQVWNPAAPNGQDIYICPDVHTSLPSVSIICLNSVLFW